MIEAVGRAVSIETETIIAIWILPRRSSRLYKGKLIKIRPKWTKTDRVACKNWNVYSPQRQNNLIFFWLPYSGLGKAVAAIYPGCAMQLDALAFLPHPTDIVPRPFASVRFDPLAWSTGSDQRRISGCGIRWLLAGPDSLPLWLCRLCAFVLLRCFSCSHTVLPKEHSLGVIFFSSLSSCKCCIFLQFYLHFTTDYTCMIVYVTNNKEP